MGATVTVGLPQFKIIDGVKHELIDVPNNELRSVDLNQRPDEVTGDIDTDNEFPQFKMIDGVKHELIDVPDDNIHPSDKKFGNEGGYLPDPDTVLNKAIPQDMTDVPTYTTDEDQFLRDRELRGYDRGPESVRNAASYIVADNQDEIEAAFRTGSFSSPEYKKVRNQLRNQLKNYQVENMGEGIVVGILSGVLFGTGAINALKKAPKLYKLVMGTPGASLMDKVKRLAIGGGGFGLATGVGVAPESEEIPSLTTAMYTAGGALASPLMAGVVKAGTKTFGAAKNALRTLFTNPTFKEADREVTQRIALQLEKQGFSAKQIEDEILRAKKSGLDRPQFAETSARSLTDDARRAMTIPTQSDEAIINIMDDRVAALPKAMTMKLKKLFNIDEVDMTSKYFDDIVETQSRKANLKYPEADAIEIPINKFKVMINGKSVDLISKKNDFFETFYNKAIKEFNPKNVDKLPPYEILIKNKNISTRTLKKIKRLMQTEIDTSIRKGDNSVLDPNGLADIKKAFNKNIEDNNPIFKQANKEFGDSAKLKEIYVQGQKYNKLDDPALEKLVAGFDAEQLKVFKTGMINNINDLAENFKGGNFTQKIFGSERQQKTFKKIMDISGKDFKEFQDIVKFSRKRVNTKGSVLGNSATALRQMADENTLPFGQGFIPMINSMLQKTQIPPVIAEQLKKKLLNADEATQRAIIKTIKEYEKKGGVKTTGGIVSDIINNPISQQINDTGFNLTNFITQNVGYLREEDTEQPFFSPIPTSLLDTAVIANQRVNKTPLKPESLL